MMIEVSGRTYRVSYTGHVEVYIPRGEPRVMQLSPRRAYWRAVEYFGATAVKVRAAHKAGLARIADEANRRLGQ